MQVELNEQTLNAIQQLGDLALRHAGAQAVPAYNLVAYTIQNQQQQAQSDNKEQQEPANDESQNKKS